MKQSGKVSGCPYDVLSLLTFSDKLSTNYSPTDRQVFNVVNSGSSRFSNLKSYQAYTEAQKDNHDLLRGAESKHLCLTETFTMTRTYFISRGKLRPCSVYRVTRALPAAISSTPQVDNACVEGTAPMNYRNSLLNAAPVTLTLWDTAADLQAMRTALWDHTFPPEETGKIPHLGWWSHHPRWKSPVSSSSSSLVSEYPDSPPQWWGWRSAYCGQCWTLSGSRPRFTQGRQESVHRRSEEYIPTSRAGRH